MPEKELNPGQIQLLWGGAISLLTIIWGVLTKRIIDLPHNYVLNEKYKEDRQDMKDRIGRLETTMSKGFTRIYDKLDEKRDKHREDDNA